MTWANVQDHLVFWSSTGGWGPGVPVNMAAANFSYDQYSPAEQAHLTTILEQLYNGSARTAALMDQAVSADGYLRFAKDTSGQGGHSSPYWMISVDKFIAINEADLNTKISYLTKTGEFVHFDPKVVIAHELYHYINQTIDPLVTGPYPSNFDFQGSTVAFENLVDADLGQANLQRPSYEATLLDTQLTAHSLVKGFSYTGGQAVDIALIADDGQSTAIDLSGRSDGKSALLLGLDGADTLQGGGGAGDFIYGGASGDLLVGNGGATFCAARAATITSRAVAAMTRSMAADRLVRTTSSRSKAWSAARSTWPRATRFARIVDVASSGSAV